MKEQDIINKYLGIPYKHGGRTRLGLDCYGLIIAIYKDLGFTLFDIEHYDKNWSVNGKNYMLENYHRQWRETDNPQFLDVVVLRNSIGILNHGGVMLSGNRFLHCCKAGTTISSLETPMWKKRFVGFYQFKERYDNR